MLCSKQTLTALISVGLVASAAAGCGGDGDSTTGTPGAGCTPSAELCNGQDDDCDGTVDEGTTGALTQVCDSSGQVGTQTCTNGSWGACVANCQASAEVCDGKDNDCDGKTDEGDNGSALTQVCNANGALGTQVCGAGQWGPCEPDCKPVAEVCDGKDNDCDGDLDEDDKGAALTEVCDAGNNQVGTRKCEKGAWGTCVGNCTPTAEDCDNKDNDCDGKTDEADDGKPLKRDCSNQCGAGTEVCAAGAWAQCTAPQPANEICNGVDDDCDGKTDEDFECAKGVTASCGEDKGECELGTKVCSDTCQWGTCLGGITPKTEACDGVKDEDCDGTVDNGCGCTNGQTKTCCVGTVTCANGAWPACPAPPVETCNGIDDNCNGKIDDGLPATPYMAEEVISGIDNCANAKNLTAAPATPYEEGISDPLVFDGYIYKADLALDKDYFFIQTKEFSDLDCLFHSSYYECYTVTVTLTEPTGQDYELCLYDVSNAGDGYTCAAPFGGKPICSTDTGQTKNKVVYKFQGGCGLTEDIGYYIEVKPVGTTKDSCKKYQVAFEVTSPGPQAATCGF